MRLNKHGWGLNEMLLWIALILFFLGIAIFYINRLYSGFEDSKKNDDVIAATNNYLANRYSNGLVTNEMMITLDTLKEETDLKVDKSCKGYVLVKPNNGTNIIEDKIDCE